jgi:hypothetical protein
MVQRATQHGMTEAIIERNAVRPAAITTRTVTGASTNTNESSAPIGAPLLFRRHADGP